MRTRKTYSQIFVDRLEKASGKGEKLVNNQTLMNELHWEPDRYWRIKEELQRQGVIIGSRGGPGGAVALAASTKATALNLFISYSHADEDVKKQLEKHLHPLERINLVKKWSDRQILPGQDWDRIISDNLKTSKIVIIMVSVDFLNSSYCYDIEMEEAIEYHDQGKLRLVPVIVGHCLWKMHHLDEYRPYRETPGLYVLGQIRTRLSWKSQRELGWSPMSC
jgi:hypothetical protein